MSTRAVSTTIKDARSAPREGLRVDFRAESPEASVFAMTDAGGVFVADLVPETVYMVPVMNAVIVDGQSFPAGTVFRVVVPDGEGPASLAEVAVEIIDWSLPAQLRAFAEMEARIAALEQAAAP